MTSSTARFGALRFLLNWKFQGPNAPFLLAEDAGWFRDEGLEVSFGIGEGSSAIPGGIESGDWDAGFGDFNALIELHAANPAAKATTIYSIYDRAPMVVISKSARGLATPSDLAGRTLSSPAFDTGFRMFPAFARAAGIDAGAVKLVPASPAERDAKLIAGEIDGAMGFDATLVFALRALGQDTDGYSLMYYADSGLDVYSSAVMASRDWLAADPERGRALLRAINRSWIEAMRRPDAAVDAVLRRDPSADRRIVRDHLQWVIDHQVRTASAAQLGLGAMETPRIERNIDIVLGMAEKPPVARPVPARLYDDRYLPSRVDRQVNG